MTRRAALLGLICWASPAVIAGLALDRLVRWLL